MITKNCLTLGELETGAGFVVGKNGILNRFIYMVVKMIMTTFMLIGANTTKENEEWLYGIKST